MEIHYFVHCPECGQPRLLRRSSFEPLFEVLEPLPNKDHAIALVCGHCKHVQTVYLSDRHPRHNPTDQVWVAEPHYGDTVHVATLVCGAEGCSIRLPLIALWHPATSAKERQADTETWLWENLRCPRGHAIPKPTLMEE